MRSVYRALTFLAVMLLPGAVRADSYIPWPDQLYVSPSGKYYVVMKRIGGPKVVGEWGPVEYVICERAADALPIKPAEADVKAIEGAWSKDGQHYEIHPHPDVRVHEGDRVLGRGKLKRTPLHVLVSDTGLGFAALDVYGHNYAYGEAGLESDDAVIVVSASGKITHRRRILDFLSDADIEPLEKTAGSMRWLHWREPGWIDEQEKELVIVGSAGRENPNRHHIWFLNWESGQTTRGPTLESESEFKKLKRSVLGSEGE